MARPALIRACGAGEFSPGWARVSGYVCHHVPWAHMSPARVGVLRELNIIIIYFCDTHPTRLKSFFYNMYIYNHYFLLRPNPTKKPTSALSGSLLGSVDIVQLFEVGYGVKMLVKPL